MVGVDGYVRDCVNLSVSMKLGVSEVVEKKMEIKSQ